MSTESTAVNQSARHLVMGLYEELDTKAKLLVQLKQHQSPKVANVANKVISACRCLQQDIRLYAKALDEEGGAV